MRRITMLFARPVYRVAVGPERREDRLFAGE